MVALDRHGGCELVTVSGAESSHPAVSHGVTKARRFLSVGILVDFSKEKATEPGGIVIWRGMKLLARMLRGYTAAIDNCG